MNWLNETLCSFDEKVRVELGPQIIELDCTDENLSNEVTHPKYRIGTLDSYGKVIGYDALNAEDKKKIDPRRSTLNMGEKMHVIDWRAKLVPKLWMVYQLQESEIFNTKTQKMDIRERFIKVGEKEDKAEALTLAQSILGGM